MLTCQLWKFAGSFTPLIEVACRWLSQDLEIETLYPIESRPVVEQVSFIGRDESYYLTLMTKRILASLDNGQPYQLVISSSAFPSILTACSSIYKCQHILRAVVRYVDTTSQIQKNLELSMRVLPTDIEYYIKRQLVTMA